VTPDPAVKAAALAELDRLADEAEHLGGLYSFIAGWMVSADPEEALACFREYRASEARRAPLRAAYEAAHRPNG
jgi:hypothetical protein